MKLKYYLRGIGIGVIVTTIIFMISMSIHKEDLEAQKTPVKESESKTVADVKLESKSDTEETTTEKEETVKVSDTQQVLSTENKKENKNEDKTSNKTSNKTQPATDVKTDAKTDSKTQDSNLQKKEESSNKKIRLEVGGGEYSDVISKKLADAGLIDNAEDFNVYLIRENYDNFILPGVYDIPMDSTYEEIAVLLTTKVDSTKTE